MPCLFSYEGIPTQAGKDAGLLPFPRIQPFLDESKLTDPKRNCSRWKRMTAGEISQR